MSDQEQKFIVRYQYGTYSGTRTLWADDAEQAVARVKRELRPYMTLTMAHEAYHVEAV